MRASWRLALLAWASAGLWASCVIYNEGLLEDDGATPSGDCQLPADCPGADSTCSIRTCDMGVCNRQNAGAGTPCTEDGGKVCDGQGACVECATEQDCMPGQSCSAEHRCQAGLADDGAPCASPSACQSGNCVDGVCCATACSGFCESCALAGTEGECTPIPDGADPDTECGADTCNGAGACRCNDNLQSIGETDVDCGGLVCMACPDGSSCQQGSDCVSGTCSNDICTSLCQGAVVVVSQVYGGGGNSGAVYKHDFVELHNRGTAPVDITGWSVQYASGGGSTWQVTELAGTIPAGGYYLIEQAAGSGGTEDLPTPDAVGAVAMSATAGKIALVDTSAALSGSCPTDASIVDFVGYGSSATCFEGSDSTPTPSATNAVARPGSSCGETDDNAADFATQPAYPNARNSATPPVTCCMP